MDVGVDAVPGLAAGGMGVEVHQPGQEDGVGQAEHLAGRPVDARPGRRDPAAGDRDGAGAVEPRRRADHTPGMDDEVEWNGRSLKRGRRRHHRGGSRITWETLGAPLWLDE